MANDEEWVADVKRWCLGGSRSGAGDALGSDDASDEIALGYEAADPRCRRTTGPTRLPRVDEAAARLGQARRLEGRAEPAPAVGGVDDRVDLERRGAMLIALPFSYCAATSRARNASRSSPSRAAASSLR